MKILTPCILVLTLSTLGLSAGCVSQSEIDDYRKVNRTLEENNLQLRNRLRSLQEERDQLMATLSEGQSSEMGRQRRIGELEAQIAQLEAALRQAEEDMASMMAGTELNIDPILADQLERLAQANPDLMEWDAKRNMIRLRSDLTFGSGSTVVKPQASETLSQLAGVLERPEAQPYEVRIVGHTDNVPVTARPGRRFQNNWELSAFRAISVKDIFRQAGISSSRMSIAGYGEFQPVVANPANGAEANRRVEIFLVPKPSTTVAPVEDQPEQPAPTDTSDADADAPTTDGGNVEAGEPTEPEDDVMFK